jgi:hypothetical protein
METKPHNYIYSQEYIIHELCVICYDLGFIPSSSELRLIKKKNFNGASVYSKIRGDYENKIVPILSKMTKLSYRSKYFFIDGLRYKSREEVYFVNFFKQHNISFKYEPNKFTLLTINKIPDFLIDGVYYDIAGYYSKDYREKIETSIQEFKNLNIPYKVICVNLSELFTYEFYKNMCLEFGVNELLNNNNGIEIYKNLVKWDVSKYDNDIKQLKELLTKIYEIKYTDSEYILINKLIKKLSFKNIKIACEILDVEFNGKRQVLHGKGTLHRTPQCVSDGSLFNYLSNNKDKSIREIEREGTFKISRKTMSFYKKKWLL